MKIHERFLSTILFIWNRMVGMVKKSGPTEEQKEMMDKLGAQLSMGEILEYYIQKKEAPKNGKPFWNILIYFVSLFVITIASILILEGIGRFVVLWLQLGFPLFCLIGIDILTYKYQKIAYYYRIVILITLLYILTIGVLVYFLHQFDIFSCELNFYDVFRTDILLIGLYLIISPPVKKKFFSWEVIVTEFEFFQTKYKIEEVIDIIKNVLLNSSHISSMKKIYEDENGYIFLVDRFILLFLASIDKCFSIAVTIESGKYIIQDEKTRDIQQMVKIIYSDILKFKELRESSMILDLKERNWILLRKYTGTPIFYLSSIKEKKWPIIIAIVVIIGIFLLSKAPREDQIYYALMLWLSILSIVLGIWASKGKH